jgi:hypothetical protein
MTEKGNRKHVTKHMAKSEANDMLEGNIHNICHR